LPFKTFFPELCGSSLYPSLSSKACNPRSVHTLFHPPTMQIPSYHFFPGSFPRFYSICFEIRYRLTPTCSILALLSLWRGSCEMSDSRAPQNVSSALKTSRVRRSVPLRFSRPCICTPLTGFPSLYGLSTDTRFFFNCSFPPNDSPHRVADPQSYIRHSPVLYRMPTRVGCSPSLSLFS